MIKLICVTANNNNKFYYMEDLNNGMFKVEYGRVGASSQTVQYPMSQWDKKYNEKIKKGYIDVTEKATGIKKTAELDISDKDVKELISFLMNCAKQSIKRDYQVSAESVTKEQLDLVQEKLDQLSNWLNGSSHIMNPVAYINETLKEVYSIIPRKMADTRNFFLNSFNTQFLLELLQSEQSRLDTLKSQVNLNQVDTSSKGITLEDLGFKCEVASQADRDLIAKNTDFRVGNQKIFKITNMSTEKVFNPDHLKTKLLYHGSRNENFLSILQTGLKIRPKGVQTTGSMFGDAIYGADLFRKSLGYTSLSGSYWANGTSNRAYMAIFEFATGKEWDLLKGQRWSGWMSRIDETQVKAKGCNSVFAKGGADLRNNEYMIYNSNQCTIRYLIEITR